MTTCLAQVLASAWLVAAASSCIDLSAIASASGVGGAGTGQLGSGNEDAGRICNPCIKKPGCSAVDNDNPNLLSGLESGCALIERRDGRDGGWFTYKDAGGSQINPDTQDYNALTVSCEAARGSCYSACVNGAISGSSYPYAGLGLVFHPNAIMYDLSRWRGVSFEVRGFVGPSSILAVIIPLAADAMVGVGSGTCTESCNDSYQTAVPGFADGLRQEWHRVQIDFADLHQLGFGRSEPWDPTTAISLQWSVTAYNATVQNEPFQFCVDQVELVP